MNKVKLYILYDCWYPEGIGRGTEKFPVSFCISETKDFAIWQFKLMGFREFDFIEEIESFDTTGYMYKVPEYLLPY